MHFRDLRNLSLTYELNGLVHFIFKMVTPPAR